MPYNGLHTHTQTSSFPFSLSFLPFICSWIYHLSSEVFRILGFVVLGFGGSSGGTGEQGQGVVLGVGEQLECLGMDEEPAESSGGKGGQGKVMF